MIRFAAVTAILLAATIAGLVHLEANPDRPVPEPGPDTAVVWGLRYMVSPEQREDLESQGYIQKGKH